MNRRPMKKTVQVPGRPYFMTVYQTGGGYFSKHGTQDTATPLEELEPNSGPTGGEVADWRTIANRHFKAFEQGQTFTNIPWEPTE